MVITPLAILLLGIVNFRRDKLRQGVIILQALAALAVWIILTFVIVMIFFMTVFEYPASKWQPNGVISTAICVGGPLLYLLVGSALTFWTQRDTTGVPAF